MAGTICALCNAKFRHDRCSVDEILSPKLLKLETRCTFNRYCRIRCAIMIKFPGNTQVIEIRLHT